MLTTATIHSACLAGLDVMPLTVDVDISPCLPQISLVGVAGTDTHEAASRVRCAIKASGFEMPQASVVVQISPSTTRPRGTQFDLAIAAAILVASGQVTVPLDNAMFVGELTLDGHVLPPRGLVCYSDWCADHNMTLVCPTSSDHISHVPLGTLAELRTLDWNHRITSRLEPAPTHPQDIPEALKSAFKAALGTSRILFLRGEDGPVSHSVIACHRSLPQLTRDQCDTLARIHSACSQSFEGESPFRCPHHTISQAGMVGGGRPVFPGEVTLANHGLLLLSDIEHYDRGVLTATRVALRDREVRIVRACGAWHMPAAPALVIATTRDVKTPTEKLLGPLANLGFEEVRL